MVERTSKNETRLSVLRGTKMVERTSKNETRLSVLRGMKLG